jgi:hypothetical protein
MICKGCGHERDDADFHSGTAKQDGTPIYYRFCPPCRKSYGRYLHGYKGHATGDSTQHPTSQERDREDLFVREFGRNAFGFEEEE